MESNPVFKITPDEYRNIIQNITKKFNETHPKKLQNEYVVDSFEIKPEGGKITFTFFKTNKLMIQSSPNNQDFIDLVNEISEILSINTKNQNNPIPSLEEHDIEFDYYIGCDEAGKGETFGSLFLGCALIQKENLKSIQDVIKNKNIRELTENNIERIRNRLQNQYIFSHRKYSASEIDKCSLNILLDKGYKDLLSKIIGNKKNITIAIDDYGVGDELQKYIDENDSVEIIVKYKADEEYPACKIASLGARYLRINEIREIDNEFVLVEESTGEKMYPGAGSPSNPNTKKYLKLFRKQKHDLEFPHFVRKKWKNVKLIDNEYPKHRYNERKIFSS